MLILSQNGKAITSTSDEAILRLKENQILHGDVALASYETEEEAKAAFDDLIAQLDEIEGAAKIK